MQFEGEQSQNRRYLVGRSKFLVKTEWTERKITRQHGRKLYKTLSKEVVAITGGVFVKEDVNRAETGVKEI